MEIPKDNDVAGSCDGVGEGIDCVFEDTGANSANAPTKRVLLDIEDLS